MPFYVAAIPATEVYKSRLQNVHHHCMVVAKLSCGVVKMVRSYARWGPAIRKGSGPLDDIIV
jgi:hypothetical protein